MENCIIVDWFAMTFRQKGITVHDIINMLGLRDDIVFKKSAAHYYYRDCISFGNIRIYFNHSNPSTNFPMLEMTGQGCREFETYSFYGFDYLFDLVKDDKNYHLARLDIAYDDHTGIFDIKKIVDDYYARNFISSSVKGRIMDDVSRFIDGFSVTTGTKSSDKYMRIYDKAIERGYRDGRHWVRCELVLKQSHAVNFIQNPKPLGEKFRGVIYNYFRFVTPSKTDTNKRRWEMRKYWRDFLGDVEKISVFSRRDVEYNLSRLGRYLFTQAGNSIDTYIQCVGLIPFLDNLIKRDSRLTPKQKYLIEQSKLLIKNGEIVDEETLLSLSEDYKSCDKETLATILENYKHEQ